MWFELSRNKVQAQKNEVSWKVLAPYYFITGHRFKVRKGSDFYPMFDISGSWADFPVPWPTAVTWRHGSPEACGDRDTSHTGMCNLHALLSGSSSVDERWPCLPTVAEHKWISLRSCWGVARRMNGEQQWHLRLSGTCRSMMGMQKGKAQTDWTQLEAARICPKVSQSWAPGRVKKSTAKELGVPHKGWPLHLFPMLSSFLSHTYSLYKIYFECSV